jgi:hypothetical protein
MDSNLKMAKHLMGIVLAGHSKDYMLPKFLEMLEHIVYQNKDVDICFVVDKSREELEKFRFTPTIFQVLAPEMLGSLWATEIVYHGKERLRNVALEDGYDSVIWQGIDCLYENAESFQRLKRSFEVFGGMVGGLVAGRNRPDYAVCRDFVYDPGGNPTTTQEEMDYEELHAMVEDQFPFMAHGYPGSDATFVSRELLENVTMKGYEHWHTRPNKDIPLGELGPEEWFVYRMIKDLRSFPLVEPRCRPWHVHETGLSSRYPGQTCDLSALSWNSP